MNTRLAIVLRLLFALLLAAPLTCQYEAEGYFSLASNRTFGSHDKPVVQLSGYRVPAVQIRVYRVKDPLKFFEQLEDAHSFGGRGPRPVGKRSLLEIIHSWKRGIRRSIRVALRNQFTESPSAHLEQMFPKKTAPAAAKATYYAEAPVLNQEQLVLSFVQPLGSSLRWESATVPIAVKEKGVFLVEAAHANLRAYTILTVSDIALVTKVGRSKILGFLADRQTGEPIPNAALVSFNQHSQPSRAETAGDGMTGIGLRNNAGEDLRVLALRDSDVAFADIGSWSFSNRTQNWTGYIYTDRPVYRPGDTMHFRGILRLQATVGYEVPASQAVAVQINDPDGKTVYQKKLTTSANGIIHDELILAKSSSLGNYYIQVNANDNQMSGNFEVQEYKKPEYEVRVTPDKPRVLEGETVKATIDARYYFGEPVKGAKVKYSVYRSRYWFPLWYDPDEETGEEGGPVYEDESGEQIVQEEGKLDDDGKLVIEIPTTESDHKIDYRYRIDAGVTDAAGREISGTGWLIATYGSFLVDIQPERYFYEPSSRARFGIEARDYDNKPVTTAVHVDLATWNWRKRTANEAKTQTDVTTGSDGRTTTEVQIPAEGGSYRLLASARTPEGRTVTHVFYFWVAGSAGANIWDGGTQRSVQIIPDKKTYTAGDTAKILLVTGKANTPVLVTVEGRDIRRQQLIRSQGASALFEYKVSADDQPGFFVSAQFIRDGEMYQSQKRIKVPPKDHELNVKVSTDKAQYLPGQTGTYNIEVTDGDGKPVTGSDLSLGVVDEAIYAIRRDDTPDILNFFYGRDYNSVYTENSLTYFFSGEAGTRRMRLAELRQPSQLAQLKPERLVRPKVRKAFPDTAFWAADITTDDAGHAQARVDFPDTLTTWRATVRGVAPEDRFGAAVLKTIVRKNLILRLAVPRFFTQSDEVVISGLVHNYLQTDKNARVSVKLQGLDMVGGTATQDVDVRSKGEAKVDWRVKAQSVRQAKITAEALTDEESDALEVDLPVNPPGVQLRQAKGGAISNTGTTNFALTFPASALAGSRSLSIRLSPSIAGSIFGALEFLTSYPYGCVEQTMSSFLPDLMVDRAVQTLGLKEPINRDDLQAKIQAGLDRLYSFQHDDGGWGWWQTDDSHPFMTAYVVAGLAEARDGGITIKDGAISKGAAWIEKDFVQAKNTAADLRAYQVYGLALAGLPDSVAMNRVYGNKSDLSPYGVALLGLAFEKVKDQRANELAGQLESAVHQSNEEASWPAARDAMLDFSEDVTPEATAYAVKLLSHQRPNSPLLPKAALWLVNHRNEGYWWSSTKQTAMIIYGLIDYIKATNELHPNLTAVVTLNGQTATTRTFNSTAPQDVSEIVLDESKLQPGTNQIQVSSNGAGRLYYSVSAIYFSNEARLERQGQISLNILRDYFRLTPAKNGEVITYDLSPLEGAVSQGDIVAVRLTVTGSDWRYLLMEDPIPAGAEFIEHDDLYHLNKKPDWWAYWFTRRELHDDRMAIFQTQFFEQQKQYFYLLKIVNPGVFHIGPARVEPMYQPEHQATTESRMLEVK